MERIVNKWNTSKNFLPQAHRTKVDSILSNYKNAYNSVEGLLECVKNNLDSELNELKAKYEAKVLKVKMAAETKMSNLSFQLEQVTTKYSNQLRTYEAYLPPEPVEKPVEKPVEQPIKRGRGRPKKSQS